MTLSLFINSDAACNTGNSKSTFSNKTGLKPTIVKKNNIRHSRYYTHYVDDYFINIIHLLKNSHAEISTTHHVEYANFKAKLMQLKELSAIDKLMNTYLNANQPLYPNAAILNQLILKLTKLNLVTYVCQIYLIMQNKKIVTYNTYNFVLNAIAHCENPDVNFAREIFIEAKKRNLFNKITYNHFLNVIAKSKNPDAKEALFLLEEAIKTNCADVITYNSALDAIAKDQHVNNIDTVSLLQKGNYFNHKFFLRLPAIDLHGLSYGSAYFLLKAILPNSTDELVLIYGKGLHSKEHKEFYHPVKEAVLKVLKEMKDNIIYSFENPYNSGQHIVYLAKKSLQDNIDHNNCKAEKKISPVFFKKIETAASNEIEKLAALSLKKNV